MSVDSPAPTVTASDIAAAVERIGDAVVRTPVLRSPEIDEVAGASIVFKCENLQTTGAFKLRGATNAVRSLSDANADAGVVTHSSGNHAAALASAAAWRGVPARIVMPANSRANKLAAVRRLGIEPILCEPSTPARRAKAEEVRQATGATLVHPFDNDAVIAGQGTAAWEFVEQVEQTGEPLDFMIAPLGGGGLLAGTALAIAERWPAAG